MRVITSLLLACCLLTAPFSALAEDTSALKKKIMFDQKKLIVLENVEFSADEGKDFWPIYDQLQEELFTVNQQSAKLIVAYASVYQTLTDDQATKIVDEYFKIREERTAVLKSYVPKLSKVLPGKKLFRYLQVETKLEAIARFEIAKEIPLAQ